MLATENDDLNSIPEFHKVEKEKWLSSCPKTLPFCVELCTPPKNTKKEIFKGKNKGNKEYTNNLIFMRAPYYNLPLLSDEQA